MAIAGGIRVDVPFGWAGHELRGRVGGSDRIAERCTEQDRKRDFEDMSSRAMNQFVAINEGDGIMFLASTKTRNSVIKRAPAPNLGSGISRCGTSILPARVTPNPGHYFCRRSLLQPVCLCATTRSTFTPADPACGYRRTAMLRQYPCCGLTSRHRSGTLSVIFADAVYLL